MNDVVEKAGGKSEKITITNENGRLTKEEIEKMVEESEKFKVEDNEQKEKIEAKNHLESYCFNIKSTLEDNSLKDKISNEERNTALEMVNETISWLDENQMADKEEYKDKQIQLENSFKPVVQKLYAGSQSGPNFTNPGGCGTESGQNFGGSNYGGPTVEEVD